MNHLVLILAVIRLCVILVLVYNSYKHRDRLAMLLAVVYAMAITAGSIGKWQFSTPVFSTPLVLLVTWRIIKAQRRGK